MAELQEAAEAASLQADAQVRERIAQAKQAQQLQQQQSMQQAAVNERIVAEQGLQKMAQAQQQQVSAESAGAGGNNAAPQQQQQAQAGAPNVILTTSHVMRLNEIPPNHQLPQSNMD